jgi:hypothetical protein
MLSAYVREYTMQIANCRNAARGGISLAPPKARVPALIEKRTNQANAAIELIFLPNAGKLLIHALRYFEQQSM